MIIRKATTADSTQLLAILDTMSPQDKSFLAYTAKKELIRQHIRQAKHIYVAEEDGVILGFARESGRSDNIIMLEEIFVAPEYRSKNVGRALFEYVLAAHPNTQMKTSAKNEVMNSLAAKNNFVKVKESPEKTMYMWEKLTKQKEANTMFRELLNNFEKYAEVASAEELDKVAGELLVNLESYLGEGVEKVAEGKELTLKIPDVSELGNTTLENNVTNEFVDLLKEDINPRLDAHNKMPLWDAVVDGPALAVDSLNAATGRYPSIAKDSYGTGLTEGGTAGGLAGLTTGALGLLGAQKLRQYLKNKKSK
jgi:N-acetylglutamate synthase-like GNAT family acetyltransferase